MQRFNSFKIELTQKLLNSFLPGQSSHLRMAPITRLEEMKKVNLHKGNSANNPRESAVLILLYPKNHSIYIAMIKRATDNTVHSGQISFPGGKVEDTDSSLMNTALREANEEVGIIPDSVEILGQLSKLYIPPSNFDVYPFVGVTEATPVFNINHEVERILEVDLNTLLNPASRTHKKIKHSNNKDIEVPCYYINGEIIWGATAMIISELVEVIEL